MRMTILESYPAGGVQVLAVCPGRLLDPSCLSAGVSGRRVRTAYAHRGPDAEKRDRKRRSRTQFHADHHEPTVPAAPT